MSEVIMNLFVAGFSLRIAVDHPEVVVMNCSLNTAHRYIRSYYVRMYEAKFIISRR